MKIVSQVLLFSLSIILFANCTASKKAPKQTEEQKIAKQMCDCLEPITPIFKKMKDAPMEERVALMQELEKVGKELELCGKDIDVILKKKEADMGKEKFKEYEQKLEGEMKVICPETAEILGNVSPR